jgi:glycosyltransferase involved in cell wall biosynthesis
VSSVSVLIPTYNGEKFIAAAIDSVLAQRVDGLELIVTDDNSCDDTVAIVSSYTDSRVRLIQNESNLGPEGNWNTALELARGDFIKLLPQDDLILPGSLARQVVILNEDRDERIALVFGARVIIDRDGQTITRRGLRGGREGLVAADVLARRCVRSGTNVIGEPGAILFRRSAARRIGRFDGQQGYVIDLDYWLRLLAHGHAWYIPEPVSAFRVSSGSWSVAIGTKQSRQFADFLDRMRARGLVRASGLEIARGKAAAWLNNVARLVFYKVIVR